jgi:hypothetical protein
LSRDKSVLEKEELVRSSTATMSENFTAKIEEVVEGDPDAKDSDSD